MLAEPDQVDAAFAEMVNSGLFKKISASFYQPAAPGNPVPGVLYLRHVGFMGAQPPAVKGLKSASFSEAEEGIVEFGDWADRVEAGLFRSLRDWIISKFSLEDANQALPGWDVSTVESEAAAPDAPESIPAPASYSEPTQEVLMDLAAQKAALDQQAAEFAERDQALKVKEALSLHTDHLSFAEGLVREGKLLPGLKDQTVIILDFAAGLEGVGVIEFGEGDSKMSQSLDEALKTFLSSQPKIVAFGEHARADQEAAGTASFASPPGYTVDATGLELHNKALAYQQKNAGVDYMSAVKACQ
jgi:hypothetical protein